MAARDPAKIRNVAFAGHAGCGKTLLTERLLLTAGAIQRMGSIEDGSTVSDWTDLEKSHQHSLSVSCVHVETDGTLVNIIDTPGLADFMGHAISALPASDMVVVVMDAVKGIETVTRRVMAVASERNFPRAIVINKTDMHETDLSALVDKIRETFGHGCLPINLPSEDGSTVINVFEEEGGATSFSSAEEAHTQILEQVVEVDEALMEEYLEKGGEGLDKGKIHDAFEQALREGHLVPICFTSAKSGAGAEALLEFITRYCPNPLEGNPRPFVKEDGEPWKAEASNAKPAVAHVFKVAADPFVGKLGVFRVHQGTIRAKSEIYVDDQKKAVRIGHMFKLQGKEHVEVDEVGAGDIAAVSKIEELGLNSVLHEESSLHVSLTPLPIPRPMYGLAVTLTNHKDEAKFGPATHKLQDEDAAFVVERVVATNQTVARGLGEMHLRVILERLRDQFGIEVQTEPPKIAYKETITAAAEGHHRHKKQSGGSGEFGEVYLRIKPLPPDAEELYTFESAVVGGAIPKQFFPAIEKGVVMVLEEGAIAGYPLRGVSVEVYDGKYHAVDSKEVAFIKAGKQAFIDAVKKAKPALLEPFVELEITAPSEYMGDITGDMATRRPLRRRRLWRAQQDGRLAGTEGIAIRTAWLTWRHLAASRGRNAKCAFRVSRKAHLEFRRGAFGWVVGMEDRREVRATHGFRAFRRRPKGYGGHSEVACGHTILSRASGPDLLLLERAGGLGVTRGCPSLRGQARGMT